MNRITKSSLFKAIHRYPFRQNPKPTSPIPSPSSLHPHSSPKSFLSTIPTSNFHSLSIIPRSYFMPHKYNNLRSYNSGSDFDKDKEVDMINMKFAEAREEIEAALESKETVYFNEEAECARAAVSEVLDLFEGLLAKLGDHERAAVQRSMGLKIEQLKAEIKQLDE